MKLKKNDLIELKKGGVKAVHAKIIELKAAIGSQTLEKKGSTKIAKRSLSQLLTIIKDISK